MLWIFVLRGLYLQLMDLVGTGHPALNGTLEFVSVDPLRESSDQCEGLCL